VLFLNSYTIYMSDPAVVHIARAKDMALKGGQSRSGQSSDRRATRGGFRASVSKSTGIPAQTEARNDIPIAREPLANVSR
jgi:hypothetical protein